MSNDDELQLTLSERRLIEFVRRCRLQQNQHKNKPVPMVLVRMEPLVWQFYELQPRGVSATNEIDFDKFKRKQK